jgi:hypothetical protein
MPVALRPQDRRWRSLAPGFGALPSIAAAGSPFHVTVEDRVDRSADMRALPRALASGKTVLFPQIHQVLPRLARLMVALRVLFIPLFREERSFLFAVHGRGLPGMGLHHDGGVESFWLQLEGRRRVIIGPPVAAGTPERLAGPPPGGRPGWTTLDLSAGSLLYLPARSPHQVVGHGRSLAVTMTWSRPRRLPGGRAGAREAGRAGAAALDDWDIVSGQAESIPRASRRRLWTQVPATAGPVSPHSGTFRLRVAGGDVLVLPAASHPLASRLATMPSLPVAHGRAERAARAPLIAHGVLGPRDLPMRIIPGDPEALDGWGFA